ncbi:MAG TPA: RES domain-containing protein, partial [Acetobacteraceae bacterium]
MPTCHVDWPQAWRIIAARYPPIAFFERLSVDPAAWEALLALEELTDPRVRDAVGEIALVPPEDRISGPGASDVMAAFTHLNPQGSRFSDGSYGVYYAAAALETAIAETVFHFAAFARDSADPP